MNIERFRTSPSGRLVLAGPQETRYYAFMPNPLPPVIAPDAELMMVATGASYALGELAALGRNMANPHLLINPFIRREAVLSSRIEGTQASIADLASDILKVIDRSAQANIIKLITAGILKQVGESSYGKVYVAEEILKVIAASPAQ